jgi:hypothetical protein
MLKPYDMLTRCLLELKSCELPTIEKLMLDMYILRVKRNILYGDLGAKVLSGASYEKEIKSLYDQICCLSAPGGEAVDVEGLINRLQKLMKHMESH